MQQLTYHLADVFTTQRFGGNQLAVFPKAGNLSTTMMQRIAKELNLSETVFVMPPTLPDHDFKLRIFTPGRELPMAGHPTVGTVFILAHEGAIETNRAQVTLEENVGTIPIQIDWDTQQPAMIWMSQPPPEFGEIFENRDAIAQMLSITAADLDTRYPIQVVSSGVPFAYVPVKSLRAMHKLRMHLDRWEQLLKDHEASQVYAFSMETQDAAATVHSRMFAPSMGIAEDPATGAACGPLGAYLMKYRLINEGLILNEQGIEMGRPSKIHIQVEQAQGAVSSVRVGGTNVYMGKGVLFI